MKGVEKIFKCSIVQSLGFIFLVCENLPSQQCNFYQGVILLHQIHIPNKKMLLKWYVVCKPTNANIFISGPHVVWIYIH